MWDPGEKSEADTLKSLRSKASTKHKFSARTLEESRSRRDPHQSRCDRCIGTRIHPVLGRPRAAMSFGLETQNWIYVILTYRKGG